MKKLWKLFWFLKFPEVILRQIVMKETIIQKASLLFLQRGFKSVTMDDLAEALAISKKHFTPTLKTRKPWFSKVPFRFSIPFVVK